MFLRTNRVKLLYHSILLNTWAWVVTYKKVQELLAPSCIALRRHERRMYIAKSSWNIWPGFLCNVI